MKLNVCFMLSMSGLLGLELTSIPAQQIEFGQPLIIEVKVDSFRPNEIFMDARLIDGSAVETIGGRFTDYENGRASFLYIPKIEDRGKTNIVQFRAFNVQGEIVFQNIPILVLGSKTVWYVSELGQPENTGSIARSTTRKYSGSH